MQENIVLISLPESDLIKIVQDAVNKALSEHSPKESATQQKKVLSFSEGCLHVGKSESTIYKLTSKKLIPHFKQGRKIYFLQSELDEWLLSNRVQTVQDGTKKMNDYLKKKKGTKNG